MILQPALSCVLVATPAFGGHAVGARSSTLAVVADSLHVAGAAGWLGTLAVLTYAAIPVVTRLAGDDRWRVIGQLVNAFSPAALSFTALVALSGITSAWLQLGSVPALWITPYGRILLWKLAVLMGVVATGAYNWRRVRPALGSEIATRRLQRSATIELLIGIVVVAVTAVLVATETPTS